MEILAEARWWLGAVEDAIAAWSDAHELSRQAGDRERAERLAVDVAVGQPERQPRFDVAFVFEAVHDLPRPVEALAYCRRMLKPGASLIVMDERVGEKLTAPGDEVERFMAACSVVWCTPQGHGPGSEVVGAVMRLGVLENLARQAGFTTVEILPIEHPFWRFYQLRERA